MYRKVAHKEYLAFAKSKKPSIDRIRLTIRQQLGYVSRDLKYVDSFIQGSFELDRKFLDDLETIRKVYEQQKYMLENNTHKVADRIVSISQPYVRPVCFLYSRKKIV